jgi:hypothetical protein
MEVYLNPENLNPTDFKYFGPKQGLRPAEPKLARKRKSLVIRL